VGVDRLNTPVKGQKSIKADKNRTETEQANRRFREHAI
jgi:hypothetical protein